MEKIYVIEKHLSDSLIFRPCDIDDFCSKYEKHSGAVDMEGRKRFIARFSRQNIMNEMSADFLEMCMNTCQEKETTASIFGH